MDIPDEVRRELAIHEQVAWYGQPWRGLRLHWCDLYLVPFSLFVFAVSALWASAALLISGMFFMVVIGILLMIPAEWLVAGRFWMDRRRRMNTHYIVTGSTIRIIQTYPKRSMKTFDVDRVSAPVVVSKFLDLGTVDFGNTSFLQRVASSLSPVAGLGYALFDFARLDDVVNPDEVCTLLAETRRASMTPRGTPASA